MSTDYFLWSRSGKRAVMVGSSGFGGTQSFPMQDNIEGFIRWAIDEGITDVVLASEHDIELLDLPPEQLYEWSDASRPARDERWRANAEYSLQQRYGPINGIERMSDEDLQRRLGAAAPSSAG